MYYEYQLKLKEYKILMNTDEHEFYAVSYWGLPDYETARYLVTDVEEPIEIDDAWCYYTERKLGKAQALDLFTNCCRIDDYYDWDRGVNIREHILENSPDF